MKSKTNISIVSNTGVRRKSEVIIGDSGTYTSGDILDANAVEQLVSSKGGGSMPLQVIDLNSVYDPEEGVTFEVAANTTYVTICSNPLDLQSEDWIHVELPSTIDGDTANICIIVNGDPFHGRYLDFYSKSDEVDIIYDHNTARIAQNDVYKCDLLGAKIRVEGEDHIVWFVQKTTLLENQV